MTIKIRLAEHSDKEPVLAFCKDTWPGGDYIPDVWDSWIRDRSGRLLVATAGKVPVGVAHCYFQTKTVAWLEGVRVSPNYRGRGIAGNLNEALFAYAIQKGAKVARLCTDADNEASRKHLTKTGFRPLREFARYVSRRSRKKPGMNTLKRWRSPNGTGFTELLNSPAYFRYSGLYADGWTWYPLDLRAAKKLATGGSILRRPSKEFGHSYSIMTSDERGPTVGFVSGNSDDISSHARYARFVLSTVKQRPRRARFLTPEYRPWIDALEDGGYERKGTTIVYQRGLKSFMRRS